ILEAEEAGEATGLEAYLARHPHLEAPLRQFFRDREDFARLAPRLAPVADTPPQAATPPPAGPAGPADPHLTAGSRFGGYEIRGELGRGGMGVVYRAWQAAAGREVALKVIRADRLAELPEDERRQWLARFQREAQLVASLDQHPHLV